MASARTCGILVGQNGLHDKHGCRLPEGHPGPHEFLGRTGDVYQWETDWDCDCEHCKACEGDYCFLYWQVSDSPQVN